MPTQPNGQVAAPDLGMLVAKILRGAWRTSPPPPDFSEQDLNRSLSLSTQSYTAGLVWWRIRGTPLAATAAGKALREQYVGQSVLAAQGTYRVYQYISALQKEGMDPILFKGWSLLPYYAEPGLRSVGDVDLAVPPEQETRAIEILRALGATAVDVDVHPGLQDPDHAAYIPGATWSELVARSQKIELGHIVVRRLGPEDNLQLLCIHAMRHLAARPYWLSDIAAVIEARAPQFDWTLALPRAPYASWVTYAILLAGRLLGANLENTPFAGRTNELPAWIVNDVLMRWSEPPAALSVVHESIFRLWRDPARWQEAVRMRVPNRFAAAIDQHGALDQPLLVRYQLRAFMKRLGKFATRNTTQKHF